MCAVVTIALTSYSQTRAENVLISQILYLSACVNNNFVECSKI